MGLNERAAKLAGYLTTAERGENGTIIVKTDDAPEWVTDLIHAVHGDLFPDDWTYAAIKDAAEAIAEDGEDATLEPDIYNRELLDWLRDYPDAVGYCDDILEESSGRTLYAANGIMGLIQAAQGRAQWEIVAAVIGQLESLDDDDDESEGEA